MADELSGQNQIAVMPGAYMHFTRNDPKRAKSGIWLLQMQMDPDMIWRAVEIAPPRKAIGAARG